MRAAAVLRCDRRLRSGAAAKARSRHFLQRGLEARAGIVKLAPHARHRAPGDLRDLGPAQPFQLVEHEHEALAFTEALEGSAHLAQQGILARFLQSAAWCIVSEPVAESFRDHAPA